MKIKNKIFRRVKQKITKIIFVFLMVATMTGSLTNIAQAYLLDAVDLLGQMDTLDEPIYTRSTQNNPYSTIVSNAVFNGAEDVKIDTVHHRLFVADRSNNRVLVYDLDENNQFEHYAADYVLGQPDFTTVSAGTTQSKFNASRYIAYDSNHQRLFVSEEENKRVTVFDLSEGVTTGMDASYVLGQPDFTTSDTTTTLFGFDYCWGLAYDLDNDYLYVADGSSHNRILIFDVAPEEMYNYKPAFAHLGSLIGTALDDSHFEGPHGLVLDKTNDILYATDTDHHRIMIFDTEEIINGESAINVLGQLNFTSDSTSTSSVGMNYPYNVDFDGVDERLFVADATNHRVMVFDVSGGVTDGMEASYVLGQIDFDANSSGATQSKFNKPRGVAYNSVTKELYVGDSGNNRIMVFDLSQGITNGMNASKLLGHTTRGGVPNWTFTTANQMGAPIDDIGLHTPDKVHFDSVGHRLFQSDQNNSRILVYNLDENNNLIDHVADYVIGRDDFFTGGSDNTGGGQAAFKWQHNSILDSGRQRLFVSDSYNNRIMVFDISEGIANGMNAAYVLGQPDFTSYDAITTISGVNGPRGFAFDSSTDRLFVADRNNHRVLVYDVAEIETGEDAINVLGQSDFTSNSATTSISGMDYPYDLALDQTNQRLFVIDKNNNRVVVYDVAEITNGEDAVAVLGQADFNSKIDTVEDVEQRIQTQDRLFNTRGVAYDSVNNWLFVVEYAGHRVMVFDVTEIENGEPAINVLGDETFNTTLLETIDANENTNRVATASNFWTPETAEIDETNRKLYVSDQNHNRTMIFQLPKITTASLSNGTVGEVYSQTISGTGGAEPYVCSLVSGTLPTGLSLNANCTITGAPSAAGTANNLVIRFSDSSITSPETVGLWHNKTFSLTVDESLANIKISAKAELTAALATYNQEDYTEENWTGLNTYKTDGDTAIDDAEDTAGVTTAKNTAINGMAGVETIAQTLKTITAFSVPNQVGASTINQTDKTIKLVVPFGTDVTDLVASFTTTGALVKVSGATQTSGQTANDFTNSLIYTVSAVNETTQNYTVSVTVLTNTQTAIDDEGAVTIDNSTPQAVIINPTQAVTVDIAEDTEGPSIDVSSFISAGTGTIPQITITAANANNVNVAIPASTTVTSADSAWDGVIAAPVVTTVTLPNTSGEMKTLSTAIEVGFSGAKLSFDKAVRLLLPNQAGKRVGYIRTGIDFTEITSVCDADSQAVGDLLSADGECKKDVGNDLVVWTKHFTSFATFSAVPLSSGGGGGSAPVLVGPSDLSLKINNDALETFSRNVVLNINAANATEMLVGDTVDFANVDWEEYASLKNWTLTSGNGEKIIYIKFRDSSHNESSVVSDTIILEEEIVAVGEGSLVKTADSTALYLILNAKRHVFPHLAVYHSWSYPNDFSTVKTITTVELNQYPEGDAVPFRDGSMFRGTTQSLYGKSASAVFYVEDGKLRAVKSGEIYQTLFNDPNWSLVTWVPDDLLAKFNYELSNDLDSSDIHPNGSLVKYPDAPAVYLIKNGKKQPFSSWDIFVANGYSQRKIFVISAEETYETAEIISSLAESLTTPVIAAMYQ